MSAFLTKPDLWAAEKEKTGKAAGGQKYDQGKSRVDLLDPEFLIGVGNVLAFGANKYAADNWRSGISFRRLLGAILRHAFAILKGEDTDPESGYPHVHHLGCTCMFLSWMMTHRKDLDDRYKYEKTDSKAS